jgi:alkaline phosphatase D
MFPLRHLTLLLCLTLPGTAAEKPLQHVLFGSCLDTHEHPMLDRALTLPCDLFLFLGDNIYADKGGSGIPFMREKYALLKNSRFFQGLRAKSPLLATWDDHDFGLNDGGADFPLKREAQTEFWNWLDEPADSPQRKQEGVYHSRLFGPAGRRVQILLLDTRTFRSPLKKVPKDQAMLGGSHVPDDDPAKTLLGEAQWTWLENALRQPADIRLIATSIQFAAEAHGGECWANLPREQQRLIQLIQSTRANGVLFLSGDRHWCEFSKIDVPGGYPLHDFTASAMTQVHPRGTPTPNAHRFLPKTYHQANVGALDIDWNGSETQLTVRILDESGTTQLAHRLRLSELHRP